MVIIDAGTGISRLMELRNSLLKSAWNSLSGVRILLTHYHFDHVAGLFWMRGIFGDLPIIIYAPGMEIYGQSAFDMLNGLFRKPYSPHPFIELSPSISVEDLSTAGTILDIGEVPLNVAVRVNPNHSDPTVALRFGDYFALVTDTPPEDEIVDFVRGVEVLLHESWYDSFESYKSNTDPLGAHREGPHTGSFGAGLVALRAGVKRLYLIHHNPERSFQDVENDAKKVSGTLRIDCRPARDLEGIELGRATSTLAEPAV